jgi:PEP-CTERM motif
MFSFRSRSARKSASASCFRMAVAIGMMLGIPLYSIAGPVTTDIEVSTDGGANWTTIAFTNTSTASNPNATVGNFKFTNTQAFMSDGPADLSSSTFHLTHLATGTDTLLLAVTSSGYTSPTAPPTIGVLSSVSGSDNSKALVFLNFQSWIDQANRTDHTAEGSPLTTGLQSGFPLGKSFSNTVDGDVSQLNSPYAVTQLFTIQMQGTGFVVSLGGQTSLTPGQGGGPQFPEPTSLTLLGISFAGMAGYGWRRRKLAKA